MTRADLGLLTAAGVLFIELMDATIVLTALPSMAASLGEPVNAMSTSVTAYAAALAAFIPASGWAADRVGGRRLLLWSLAAFVAASMLCAFSATMEALVIGRALQGGAAAMMAPVARLIVIAGAERSAMMRTIALLTWPALLAPLVAPLIGGWLTEQFGWRSIFLVNLPLGLAAMAATAAVFHREDWTSRERPLDAPGLLLAICAGAGLVVGLDMAIAGQPGWLPILAIACAALIAFVSLMRRAKAPLVDLGPLAIRTFAVATAQSGALMRLAINAMPYLLALMFQTAFDMSPTEAGGMLTIYMAGNIAMKPATSWILNRWGFRDTLAANGVLGACVLCGLAFCGVATPPAVLYILLFVAGLSRSMNFTATNTLMFADVAPDQRNDASTLASSLQQAMFSLGVGTAAAGLAISMRWRGVDGVALADFRNTLVVFSLIIAASAIGYHVTLAPASGGELRR